MKNNMIISASIIGASIIIATAIYAFATRYEGTRACFQVISHERTYPAILDRWTGKVCLSHCD